MLRYSGLGLLAVLALPVGQTLAQQPAPVEQPAATVPNAAPPAAVEPAPAPEAPSPVATALRKVVTALPIEGTDEDKNERSAIAAFYEARSYAPVWVMAGGFNPAAMAAISEIGKADAWGLEARSFIIPSLPASSATSGEIAPDLLAGAELDLALTLQKYARFARGGRIANPAAQLNSNYDRRPQFIDPKEMIAGVAAADDPAAYLRALHPQHPQFERLRQKYVALTQDGRAPKSPEAKRFIANMEMWRWMWRDLGDLHIIANVPEFMLSLYKDGSVVHSERIVAGETGKQTSIFSRRIKHIVLRPAWRVPESIKVLELWPSLKRGGGLMVQYGLQLETKDGRPLDWRTIDWNKEDIRNYEVTQPPGRRSVLGHVKFSFPSQHTIYMHDTPDKWMFNASQRTLSHGCLRLRNPMALAEILLAADKGWDRAKIDELSRSGPLNNEVAIEGKIPLHITYFTAWVDDSGALKTWADIYGHEKRITLALEGKWNLIAKGRDHLAPVEPTSLAPARVAQPKAREKTVGDYIGAALGNAFLP